jgi:hypothetical protein
MIGASRDGKTCTFAGELPAATTAFVDLDWISRGTRTEPVHALMVSDRELRYGETSLPPGRSRDPEREALLRLSIVARRAVSVIESLRDGSVAVVGDGLVAATARAILGRRLGDGEIDPGGLAAAIDFTGRSSGIEAAMRLVAPLGIVVLAGVRNEPTIPVNMYRDAHVRGLHVIGVEPLLAGSDDETMPESIACGSAVPRATVAASGIVPLAPWYSFNAGTFAPHEL